ncbi:Uncharacterised protein [Mycobacteroides abscessus subsp. abscessus]|jgi:hypothetical protein|nr:Uncharacterised protein [Mycobacteroides abscessus subsp. abscessus]
MARDRAGEPMAERAGCAASLMALSESSQFLPVRPLPVVLRDEMA